MNKMNKKGKIIGLSLVAIMVVSLFTAAVTAQAQPDLVITNFQPVGGKIQYTIANIGGADAPRSSTGVYDASGRRIARGGAPPLLAGESRVMTINCRGGSKVCADYQNRIAESNEGNNCYTPGPGPTPTPTPTPTPGALPDLVVKDKWETFANGEVTVHFIVKNIGTAEAGTSTACKEVNGVVVDTDDVPKLGPDKEYTGAFAAEYCTPGKTITVKVCADNYGVVAESNEANNCKENTFTCPAGPQPGGRDLVIQITKVEKQVVNPLQYKVKWTATNIGNAIAAGNQVALFIGGVKVDECGCAGLGPLATDSGDFGWKNCAPCGATLNVEVRVDYYNIVDEPGVSENNNNDSTTVNCRLGDIEVNKTVWNGTHFVDEINANSSDVVKFNCTVHNNGSCCNLTNITVTDVLSDSLEFINATGPGTLVYQATINGVTTLKWNVTGPLDPCEWLNYTIFARVKKTACGVDTNTQTATAKTCTGETVTDSDTAKVKVATRAGIKVTKIYNNGNFTLSVINNGSCCDLTNVEVLDTMTNLTYMHMIPAGSDPPLESHGAGNVTRLEWTIPLLTTGTTKTFMVNATKEGQGPYTNELSVRGTAVCTGAFIADSITIVVP